MAIFTLAGDYIIALLTGWPGLLVGLLLLVELLEGAFNRRVTISVRAKAVVAAIILIIGAVTMHPTLSGPAAAAQRSRELEEQQLRDTHAPDAVSDRQRDEESDQRLRSEANSLRKELDSQRRRPR